MISLRLPVLLCCLAAMPLAAHHAATVFDRDRTIVVEGTVREFRWTSPHAWIFLDVPRDGTVSSPGSSPADEWAFEGASLAVMVRNGWKSSSLRAGDRVRVQAAPRKDGTHGGEFLSVTLTASGKVMGFGKY
jgi:hypothetical protein